MTNPSRQSPNTVDLDKIPNKIYYSISEASEYTGVEAHVLRYWETKFSKLNPKRVSGNQRKYTRNDLELLYAIVRLLYDEGYTLDGAERKLRLGLQALKAEQAEAEQETQQPEPQQDSTSTPSVPQPTESQANPNYHLLAEIKRELEDVLKML